MKLLLTASIIAILTAGASAHLYAADVSTNPYATAAELGLMQGFPVPADKRVDKSNAIVTAPYNRWSYLHMRTIYPTAEIDNAEIASKVNVDIDASIEKLSILNPATNKKVSMDAYLEQTFTDAFVVIKGDKVVYERYLNDMNENQQHQMMSVTKSFAGLLGLMAVEDGLLSEDEKILIKTATLLLLNNPLNQYQQVISRMLLT